MLGRAGRRAAADADRPGAPIDAAIDAGIDGAIDPEDARIVRAAAPYTMTGAARLLALIDAVRYVVDAGVPGDLVECGVWKGGSMLAAALVLRALGVEDRALHLYDTFDGMTEPGERDRDWRGRTPAEFFRPLTGSDDPRAWCRASLETARSTLARSGYDPERIRFVPGPVEHTLAHAAPERVALLRLDTDWYASTRHELEQLWPRLAVGGVLIVDDYGHWRGARRAVDEYFSGDGPRILLSRIDYTGRIGVKCRA